MLDIGLRQCFFVSPTPPKIYVDEAIKVWQKSCIGMGLKMNAKNINRIRFKNILKQ